MKKKIIAVLSILVLGMTTIGTSLVTAHGLNNTENNNFFSTFFNDRTNPTLEELIDTYNELAEAKQELKDLKESYEIDVPDFNNEEKRMICNTIRELQRDGYSRNEIREEIIDLLLDFGIELPNFSAEQRNEIKTKIRNHLETEYGFVFIQLSAEQKAYLKQTFIQLKRDGESKEEIRKELINLYEGYGGIIPDLTETEKEEIYNWSISMIEQDYDVDLLDITYEQRQEIKNKKEEIHTLQKQLREQLRHANWLNRFRFFRFVKRDRAE